MYDYGTIAVLAALRQRLGENEIKLTRAELEQAERIKVETFGGFDEDIVVRIVVQPS